MKRLIIFVLLLIGILSFGSLRIYANDISYTTGGDKYQIMSIDLSDIDDPINTETPDNKFLNDNDLTKLMIALVIYIIALFLGILIKSKLLIALTGLLWLIPLVTIDSLIIKLFSVIMLIISFMILIKERDDYYD